MSMPSGTITDLAAIFGSLLTRTLRQTYSRPQIVSDEHLTLSLVNERKRLYSFVREFLPKRWFCDARPTKPNGPSGLAGGGVALMITIHRTFRHIIAEMSKLLDLPRKVCQVNHLQAIFGPNAPHDSVDVVLHSLLGKV